MSVNAGIFRRYEKKYMLDRETLDHFLEAIRDNMVADRFDRYTIRNIYFDTDNFQIIRRSIEKPVYKEKLRFRCYGDVESSGKIYMELKKKYKREVFKRRVSMDVTVLNRYLGGDCELEGEQQILSEIEYFMGLYHPVPKIFIAYERTALSGRDDPKLRITFDENIRFRTSDLNLFSGDEGQRILEGDQILMEIKVPGVMPLWLSRVLGQLGIYPISFSKYGYCFSHYICRDNTLFMPCPTRQLTAV